jgi:hypothetical protein
MNTPEVGSIWYRRDGVTATPWKVFSVQNELVTFGVNDGMVPGTPGQLPADEFLRLFSTEPEAGHEL